MNPDGTQDSFGVAFRGDDKGNIWRDGEQIFSSNDSGMRELHLGSLVKPAFVPTTDLLKISGCVRLSLTVDSIYGQGCLEDAIDINHSHDISIVVNDLYPGDKYCSTIKGGSTNIRIVVGRQHGHGSEMDYDLGNFSDQSNAKTTGVSLHINTVDRTPVTVRVLTADKPILENSGAPYEQPQIYHVTLLNQGWFYPLYNFLKDLLKKFNVGI